MDDLVGVFQGSTRLLAALGGGISAVCVAWAGILWMTSSGEPQKLAQARMAVIGALGRLVVVGLSFALPRAVSVMVIEPAGGVTVENRVGVDCDRVLKTMIVSHRTASTGERIQQLVKRIQVKRGDCQEESWNPVAKTENVHTACFWGSGSAMSVAGLPLPAGFYDPGDEDKPYRLSRRDSSNNILVYWSMDADERPSDGSMCWLYMASLDRWADSGTVGGGTP